MIVFRFSTAFIFMLLPVVLAAQASVNPAKPQQVKMDSSGWRNLMDQAYAFLYKPGSEDADMRQANSYAAKALRMSKNLQKQAWQADVNLLLSAIARESGNKAQALRFLDLAEKSYQSRHEWNRVGVALMEKKQFFGINGKELDERILIVRQAASFFSKGGDKEQQAGAYKELGDLLQIRGEYSTALIELKKSLSLYKQINYKQLQGIYDLLGNVSTVLSMFQEGLEYGLLAVRTAEAVGDSTMQLCTIYNRVGITYLSLSQFSNAYKYFQKSMDVALKHQDHDAIFIVASNIAGMFRGSLFRDDKRSLNYLLSILSNYKSLSPEARVQLLGGVVDTYDRLHLYNQAQKHFTDLRAIMDQTELPEAEQRVVYSVGAAHYLHIKDLKKAEFYISEHKRLVVKNGGLSHLAANHHWAFKLDSLRGNYLDAIRHYQIHKMLRDSIVRQEKQQQIALLNVRFDIERKDQELKMKAQNIDLLTKRAGLQQALLEKTRLNRNITVAILILSVLLLALLYSRYRTRQRTSQAIEQSNAQLKKMVDEKSWLIREIHHRVKNNLQIVISLLNIQSSNLQNEAAAKAIRESQARMYAMSLIHQKLYMNAERASIDMQRYIQELAAYLKESFDLGQRIALDSDVDIIELDVSQAVPIGLILNEAITNSIKYGFPSGSSGQIRISLRQLTDQSVELSIRDNGVGLPAGMDWQNSLSTGFSLISTLADQIDASLSVQNDDGVMISLKFVPQPVSGMQV